jgi:hypothetical protein
MRTHKERDLTLEQEVETSCVTTVEQVLCKILVPQTLVLRFLASTLFIVEAEIVFLSAADVRYL